MQGQLYIIAAPSGAGKTSLVKALIESVELICVSLSSTTRPQRPGEQDGIHYNFISKASFEEQIAKEAFLEYAKVFDNYYGTSRQWVAERLQQGIDVILEIDWQGAQQIKRLNPECFSIFILPPSLETLRQRLTGRGQDSEAVIEKRLAGAITEMQHYHEFDFLIVNDDFDTALRDLQRIVHSQRLRQPVQAIKLQSLLQDLACL